MTVVTVAYPAGPKFDLDYYLGTHMPLVDSRWKSMGLSGWQILRGVPDPEGTAAPNQITAILTFSSLDAFKTAAAQHGAEIFGDIPNFTEAKPVVQFNEVASK